MFEKLAWWVVLIQLPVYISQKDVPGGLHWGQDIKGILFFFWALVQNILPVFIGGYADKSGYKKTLAFSFAFILTGYFILGSQIEFYPILIGMILLGIGSGIFKPALQGAISATLNKTNSSIGWGIYFMLINLSVFAAPPISKFLKELSWQYVFYGSFCIFVLNLIVILFIRNKNREKEIFQPDNFIILKKIFRNLFSKHIGLFVILLSGFTIIYMQFYETLPNFIMDWSDTGNIVELLWLPKFFTMSTNRGIMISYEWLYNINTILTIIFIVWAAKKSTGFNKISVIISGISLAIIGLTMCGSSYSGYFLIFGFVIYTIGEMLTNPKINDYLSDIAGKNEKAMYLSYFNLSFAIGLSSGSLLGGYMYKHFAEKAGLAFRYIMDNHLTIKQENLLNSFLNLSKYLHQTPKETTELLWKTYNPEIIWLPFIIIGIISIIGLIYYRKYFFVEK